MKKDLLSMTNEELWALFPIALEEHNPLWSRRYEREAQLLGQALNGCGVLAVHHMGSTAVSGLVAKPIIDILVKLDPDTDSDAVIGRMKRAGYIHLPQPDNPAPHSMFVKGYTPQGFRGQAFHVHLRYDNLDELYFRDYLIEHADEAAAYAALKRELAAAFTQDRDGYTQAKTQFITRVTQKAKAVYAGRHETEE